MFRFEVSRIKEGGSVHLIDFYGLKTVCGSDSPLAPLVRAFGIVTSDPKEMLELVTCNKCKQSQIYKLHRSVQNG